MSYKSIFSFTKFPQCRKKQLLLSSRVSSQKQLSKKFRITDTKIYGICQEKIIDSVLFLQIYCPSNCKYRCDIFRTAFSKTNPGQLLLLMQSLLKVSRFETYRSVD